MERSQPSVMALTLWYTASHCGRYGPPAPMVSPMRWLFAVLAVALLLARLPSVVQPAGGDQGIYAYVGQSILKGEVPYRDAWDQKPPGVHLTYAAMLGLWRNDSVVATTDLAVAALVAVLLVPLGRRLTGRPGAGETAAIVFLLLGDPSFQRLGGLWVRGQAETFIALAVTGALLAAFDRGRCRQRARPRAGRVRLERGGRDALRSGIRLQVQRRSVRAALPAGLPRRRACGRPAAGSPEPRRARPLWRQLPAFVLGAALVVGAVAAWLAAAPGAR